MLRHLTIKNIAIAESLDIEFQPGLTVLTGETGAGKSIILGAMGLILGDRADRDVVRSGASKADISAEFDISRLPQAINWLISQELLEENDVAAPCLIRRTVSADGRSRAWINGSQMTLQALSAFGKLLMDIHSQHEHHSLLQRATQLRLLDGYAGLTSDSASLQTLSDQIRQIQRDLDERQQQQKEKQAQLELVSYQLEELQNLELETGEVVKLETELEQLDSAEDRIRTLSGLINLCQESEEGNLCQMLQLANQQIQSINETGLSSSQELLATALINVEEASSELRQHLDKIEVDPERLDVINQRLADIQKLARKHKVGTSDLPHLQTELEAELAQGVELDQSLTSMQQELEKLKEEWQKRAAGISKQRRKAAKSLSRDINAQLAELAMPDARLSIVFTDIDAERASGLGLEQAEYYIATNTGQAAKPLSKIASGGELSRISLAIQVITAKTTQTPTLVFDEVDVGIGGAVARTVGKLLRQLGERSQILCVTHQALVAGQAHQHLHVSKNTSAGQTLSQVNTLCKQERLEEVARMLGGETDNQGNPSEESLAHAREVTLEQSG